MIVYFGASFSLDRSQLPRYRKIVQQLEKLGHTVNSPHVVDPQAKVGDGLSAKKLFAREAKLVEAADVMVAEVSLPSWGTAFLMEHALKAGKPVLALFYKDTQHQLPLMIQGHPEFYVDHYNDDNLHSVLKRNFSHFTHQKNNHGKLIVIDGADGAGKATQTQLLLEYLKKRQLKAKYISFPRYHTSFHGHHVGRFLSGEFGGNTEVSPYLTSLAFALDRLTVKDEINEWLEEGNIVVADRYTSANMAHQAAKLPQNKQDSFIRWIYDMEYKEHKLPKEDIVLFLSVPAEISQQLLDQKSGKKNNGGKKDVAEVDLEHQKKSVAMYAQLAKRFKHWRIVECTEKGKLLSKDAIHQKILQTLKKAGILPVAK